MFHETQGNFIIKYRVETMIQSIRDREGRCIMS